MKISGGEQTSIAQINATGWDANLIVPAARIITVDHIAETTGGHGIVHNMNAIVDAGAELRTNHITEVTGAHGVTVAAGIRLNIDHIAETTPAHDVVMNNNLTVAAAAQLNVDHVENLTGGHGVIIGGASVLRVDHISETTGAHNIVLDNTETGLQRGTGNSTTGAVLAKTVTGTGISATAGDNICGVRVIRAGTYKVKVYNWVVFAGGGACTIYKNASGTVVATTTANNAAYTDEDLGDQVFAAGDVLMLRYDGTTPAGQCMIMSFYNADGMWQ